MAPTQGGGGATADQHSRRPARGRSDSGPLHPERFSRTFTDQVRQARLPAIRLHDLRHTWATLALSAGEHPKIVQERLGHAPIAITLGVYSHVTEGMHGDAASRVAGLIFGTGVSTRLATRVVTAINSHLTWKDVVSEGDLNSERPRSRSSPAVPLHACHYAPRNCAPSLVALRDRR